MRLLIWPLVLTLFLLVGIIAVISPFTERHQVKRTLPIHKTLYLERGIYDEEMFHIIAAAIEWNEVTDGQVIFDVKRLPQRNIDMSNSIIFIDVNPDYPEIILLDAINNNTTLGYFDSGNGFPFILLVDERISDGIYNAVIMHELGHALGLEHIKGSEGIGTLMYPITDVSANHITKTDLYYFCKLYNCDSSKFHVISQIQ